MKVRKFESGLRPTILGELVALQLQSYSETVERACLVEEEMLVHKVHITEDPKSEERGTVQDFIYVIFREEQRVVSQFGSVSSE